MPILIKIVVIIALAGAVLLGTHLYFDSHGNDPIVFPGSPSLEE